MENSLRPLPTEKKSLTARKSTTSLLLASHGGTNSKKNKMKQNKNKTRISGEKIARTPRFMGKRKVRSRAFVISVRPYHDKFSKKTEDNKFTPIHISLILNFQLNSLRRKSFFSNETIINCINTQISHQLQKDRCNVMKKQIPFQSLHFPEYSSRRPHM